MGGMIIFTSLDYNKSYNTSYDNTSFAGVWWKLGWILKGTVECVPVSSLFSLKICGQLACKSCVV